ncbi:hypothetical protein AVEN_144197-1, partial [Araneus ventricosus]
VTALKISGSDTLSVTVAVGTRSFSDLKLIKMLLRSPVSQERLVG